MKAFLPVTIAHSIANVDNHTTVLFVVSAVVWLGIVGYLVLLHTKVKKLEKRLNEKK